MGLYSKGPLLRNFTYKNRRTTFWGRWLRTFRTAQTREFLSPTVLAQRALIDSVPTVIMHSAMVAMVHERVRANAALRDAKGAGAARRHRQGTG